MAGRPSCKAGARVDIAAQACRTELATRGRNEPGSYRTCLRAVLHDERNRQGHGTGFIDAWRGTTPASAAWCPAEPCRRSTMSGIGIADTEAVDGPGICLAMTPIDLPRARAASAHNAIAVGVPWSSIAWVNACTPCKRRRSRRQHGLETGHHLPAR